MRKLANGGSTSVDRYGGMVDTSGLSPDCYEQCEFESRYRYYFILKGDIRMKGMHGIYRINPALFGGILGGCTGILLRILLF